ncbi:type I polyketide synthase [Bordetella sp. N]|uniref:type I polyketide synthase n=1 Tax=Bordetella sp. N TaxID=1746199 RepID=UPI000710EB3C|nr:type I polyketide synthase [Bordetella sp. N]ALM86454.1 beta-ketoacyl synthase [Bordetella sp. N]
MGKRVAIVGLAFRFPGTTTETYWTDLLEGKDLITQVQPGRWSADAYLHPDRDNPGTAYTHAAGSLGDISGFDADFFGISPREAAQMDPQQRLLLEMTWEALEDAGIKPTSLRGSDCGVYIGISSADYGYRVADDLDMIDASTATGNTSSIAANRLSYFFDLRGPSIAMDTACSSSLVAFHQASRAILSGECSHAITGGISLHLHPYAFIGFSKASMLSRRGLCSVFDAAGDGYVRSEGGGVFVLKDYDQALADGDRILAVVAASVVNTDGRKTGLTVPNADAQADLMRRACTQAGIEPDELDYLEAHGTGTAVGDPIETCAIGAALGKARPANRPLAIGSIKSNMGHLEPASGVAGMVKAIYTLVHRIVPATIGVRTLNPHIDFQGWNIEVVTQNRQLKAKGKLVVGVNSFGFGGANAHVILQSAPLAPEIPVTKLIKNAPVPLIVSGRNPEALRAAAAALAKALRTEPERPIYDFAYHAAHRRDWHAQRALVFAGERAQAAADLQALAEDKAPKFAVPTATALQDARGPVFVYSGNGSQWAGMGRRLKSDPVFAAAIDEVDALFAEYAGFSVAALFTEAETETEAETKPKAEVGLEDPQADHRYHRTELAQPALFALQVGITRMLAQRGVVPAATMGHSVGEVAAAWACGALSLAEAAKVIHHRSRLQGQTRGKGRMSAVGLDGAGTQALLDELDFSTRLVLAGSNSSRGATVAGDPEALDVMEDILRERGVFHRRLDLDYAFHSPAMDEIETDIRLALADLRRNAAEVPFYSTVSGMQATGAELDAGYWWHNVRHPVRFAEACNTVIADGLNVFVEIGPHPVLRGYIKDALDTATRPGRDRPSQERPGLARPGRIIITAARGDDAPERIYDAAGQAILSGADVDWQTLFPWKGDHTPLPTYPWQRERHWYADSSRALGLLMRERVHPLLGYAVRQHAGIWEHTLDTGSHPTLTDHGVGGAIVFPGTGFVELALAAALEWQPGTHADIEDLDIRAPLVLGPAPGKRTRVTLDHADGRFQILSRDIAGDAPWTVHAAGRVRQQANAACLNGAQTVTPPMQEPDFDEEEHHALTRLVGLAYGPAFRAIVHGWRLSADVVFAKLKPHASLTPELSSTHLHPALLDCAFQLIIHLLRDEAAMGLGIAFVPARIGRISLHAGQGLPRYARASLRRRAPHSVVADFDLYDGQGHLVANVHDVNFRAVRLGKPAAELLDYVDCVLTPRPHPYAPLPATALSTKALDARLRSLTRQPADRYSQEVDPLLESLCDRYAIEALRILAKGGALLPSAQVERQTRQHPRSASLYDHVLARAAAAGYVHISDKGWELAADEADQPTAAEIWNSLLREYPDYFPAIFATGRVGLHLPALLTGSADIDQIVPRSASPMALSRMMLGPGRSHTLAAALSETLQGAVARRAPGQRLAVLEIASGLPLLGTACCAALDFDVADYRYATTDAENAEAARNGQLADYPLATVAVIAADTMQADGDRYDLILLHGEFDTLDAFRQALAYARASLKPGGNLLLRGTPPTPWMNFIFGGRPSWWLAGKDGVHAPFPNADDSIACLREMGLDCAPVIPLGSNTASAPYLILAGAPAVDIPAPEPAARTRLVLSDAASVPLLQALRAELDAAAQQTVVAPDVTPTTVGDALLRAKERHGQIHEIILLAGWRPDAMPFDSQVARCALAAAVIQACEHSETAATVWLVTRNAGLTMGGGDPRDDGIGDAPLWGYGRTLANEATNYRIRQVDVMSATGAPALAREVLHPGAEDEVLLDVHGARYVPRVRIVARPVPPDSPPDTARYGRLGFDLPGQLRNLYWQAVEPQAPAADQIEIRVQATGLNFRDVMYTLGLLPDDAIDKGYAGPTLGLEFAGEVMWVGSGVTGYEVGDSVVGFGPSSFGERVLTRAEAIVRIPPGLSYEAAATIPSTFFTAYYALHHLARLEEDEKVLIHGGAGGVGVAAIQLAQAQGAEIYATAGSDEKRDFLRLMGVTHVYDSRSLSYADEILADTGGAGVDVVLNSLAGEAINRNLHVLRPFGRFLELGKRDFHENTRIGLRPLRNNISYFGIDADQLLSARPDLTRRLFNEMMRGFADGMLHPLPYSVFDANEVVDAFRHMQQARQIGKIIVTYRNGLRHVRPQHRFEPRRLTLPADASYLVTGGLAGFGLRTAQWLAAKGARHLVLISRRGAADEEVQSAIAALQQQGVQVCARACDVTDKPALQGLLEEVARDMPPLRGIVHAAAVIEDGLARTASADRIERNMAAKLLGAQHLHELTLSLTLDFCVYYSSATTLFGNPGQSSYIAANQGLEALAMLRREAGLPATCVRWGAIDDVGFLARNEKIKEALLGRMGGTALSSALALDALEELILADTSGQAVLDLSWSRMARMLPSAGAPKFSELLRERENEQDMGEDIAHLLATLDDKALHDVFSEMLKTEIGEVLRIAPDKIAAERSLYDMGMDSLMGVELIAALETRFGVRLPVMTLSESPTVDKLASRLIALLRSDAGVQPGADVTTSIVEKLVADHAAEIPETHISQFLTEFKDGGAEPPIRMIP